MAFSFNANAYDTMFIGHFFAPPWLALITTAFLPNYSGRNETGRHSIVSPFPFSLDFSNSSY